MATLTITNVSTEIQPLNEFYTTLAVGASITATRSANDLPGMSSIGKLVAAGKITVAMTLDSDEIASGFAQSPDTVEAADLAPVAATTSLGGLIVLYKAFTALAAGTADDVTLVAPGGLPGNVRVLDVIGYVTTNIGSSTGTLRDATAGGGTSLGILDTGTTGRKPNTGTATNVVLSTAGLYSRRSDRGVAGQVIVLLRPET